MLTVLQIELFKIFKRPRTYIAFVAITAIVVLIQLAFYADGESYVQFMLQAINESFDVEGKILNGYLICLYYSSNTAHSCAITDRFDCRRYDCR